MAAGDHSYHIVAIRSQYGVDLQGSDVKALVTSSLPRGGSGSSRPVTSHATSERKLHLLPECLSYAAGLRRCRWCPCP